LAPTLTKQEEIMGHCCGPDGACEAPEAAVARPCPRCAAVGSVLGDETIEAILKPGVAAQLLAVERRFCATPGCAVLYYGADGRVVEKNQAAVRVGAKETGDPIPLCYCFEYTRAHIRNDVAETGDSAIPARIAAEIRAGRCQCERKNPSGKCCLGEVNTAVKEAKEALARERAGEGG
jgi:hypothetical protein